MKPILVAPVVALLAACSLTPPAPPPSSAAVENSAARRPLARAAGATREANPAARHVGDVVIHRVSGSYRSGPLVLSEEVVGQEGKLWVVDLILEDAGNVSRLRVRMDAEGQVKAVAHREDGRETPASLDDYQAFVDKTMLVADQNEGLLASERHTCLVGSRELDCEIKSYKVRVRDQPATLRVSHSDELGGRDVEGEIKTSDGRVLYRSELVAVERTAPGTASR
jgi:hypothetical protein